MIKKVIMYSVICDRCGKVNGNYDGIWMDDSYWNQSKNKLNSDRQLL